MNLIRFLKSQGHIVRVLCADQNKKGEQGFFVVPNYNFPKIIDKYVKKVGVTLAKPDENIVRTTIQGSDVVHVMLPLMLGMFATKIANEYNIPVTAGFHMQTENFTAHLKANKLKLINAYFYKFIKIRNKLKYA